MNISCRNFTIMMFCVCGLLGFTIEARPSYIYYCPKSNLYLADGPVYTGYQFEGDKGGVPFPHNIEDYWNNYSYIGNGFIHYDETCATSEYWCANVQIEKMDDTETSFIIFLPKNIEVGKSYTFKNVQAIVTPVGDPYRKGWSGNQVQVTLWQSIAGAETPMKFNVEQDRGIVYWTGLDFWSGKERGEETCFLQSKKGLFADVKINTSKFPRERQKGVKSEE